MKKFTWDIWLLIISSILTFLSIFANKWSIMGIGFLQYFIVLAICLYKTIFKRTPSFNMIGYNNDMAKKYFSEKKYFKSSVYFLVIPIMTIGVMFIIVSIACMIFVFKDK